MAHSFIPQPYPLYAVTAVAAEEPARLELTDEPVRLVLGWIQDADGTVLPALADSPSPTAWDGIVLYEETRERAEATAKLLERADRAALRDARLAKFLGRFNGQAG
jgi:hypothetical protein